MDRDLVERRGWISRQDYSQDLAFAQLSPGPLAAQLAMYIGWLKAGRAGALLVSIAFISPSFLMAVAIAAAYVKFGRLPWLQDLFYGVGAAVIAIIGQSTSRLARKTIGKERLLLLLLRRQLPRRPPPNRTLSSSCASMEARRVSSQRRT